MIVTDKYKYLLEEIHNILTEHPEAYAFAEHFAHYAEYIDDLIDEPSDPGCVNKTTFLAGKIYSSNYWQKNSQSLILVQQLIHTIYFVSVEWEKSDLAWKRRDAKSLSHCGCYMLLAILLLETKDPILVQRLASGFLEKIHIEHLNDLTSTEIDQENKIYA